jgi:chloramphenicol 3-O phosphotransferase
VSPGQIVVLNGAPRSGKSSIAAAIQETFDGLWVNLGVDVARSMTPARFQPGIGLRPGEPDHPAALVVPALYAALYESIAAHADEGVNVVTDVGHHDVAILRDCARRLAGRRAALVGVRCPIEVVMERRNASAPGSYATGAPDDPPAPVRRWQEDVHVPGLYDLDVDTSVSSPEDCADAIRRLLAEMPSPTAFERHAASEV